MTQLHLLVGQRADLPTLVLLHAFPFDHRMWDSFSKSLRYEGNVVVPDIPERELTVSAVGAAPASLDAAADDLVESLQAIGCEQLVLVGVSMGGYAALAVADRHPNLIAGLALVDSRATADPQPVWEQRAAIVAQIRQTASLETVTAGVSGLVGQTTVRERSDLVLQLTSWASSQPLEAVIWCQEAMAHRPDRSDVFANLGAPTLVVVGEEDTVTPVVEAAALAESAATELVVVPQAGHLAAVEQPQLVATAVRGLLARVVNI